MQSLVKRWKEHLQENKMTYCQHWLFAVGHGLGCLRAGLYLCVHGIFPCFYRHAGSSLVHKLELDFVDHKEEVQYEKTKNDTHE